ncbi:hypothetical protein BMW26_07325 [Microbacterium sp. 1.5R]|uniref:hypothetical protein n=1 Tax=Microbacterium TaxID=33882 RepID=UPI00069DC528|nr:MULTISPECIES: hypothetical protein [unclassified Microbacterium]AKV85387.1 NADH:ubiquinone oxidoreductase [Microbacterium sp. CGR1]APH44787.1 hypothetical protein BMW26_07325 [Microbacterium sp. 1.5R]KRD51992.1 NADH:ubiquinone oxidoreductase [Microbacterium sp. Root280D1]MBC6494469.1 hypothetical protein [Microbacterium sp. 4-7]MDY0982596.1 hypothetical protein [Microbacterium sp. CFBP9023]
MNYLSGTGIVGAIMTGVTLLRGSRDTKITWRSALAWVSWGITLALSIGAVIDTRRAKQGRPVSPDSPVYAKQQKEREKEAKKQRSEGVKPIKR